MEDKHEQCWNCDKVVPFYARNGVSGLCAMCEARRRGLEKGSSEIEKLYIQEKIDAVVEAALDAVKNQFKREGFEEPEKIRFRQYEALKNPPDAPPVKDPVMAGHRFAGETACPDCGGYVHNFVRITDLDDDPAMVELTLVRRRGGCNCKLKQHRVPTHWRELESLPVL